MRDDELDAWLPSPKIRSRHTRTAQADPDRLWDAASAVRLDEAPAIARLVHWRLPGTRPDESFYGLLAAEPFTVLDEGHHWSLSGMCGRIWTLSRDYPRLSGAEDFRNWSTPGTVRVLFAHWIEPAANGDSSLFSETRVSPVDRRAALALRSLWLVIGAFERLIGAEVLALAVRHAQTAAADA